VDTDPEHEIAPLGVGQVVPAPLERVSETDDHGERRAELVRQLAREFAAGHERRPELLLTLALLRRVAGGVEQPLTFGSRVYDTSYEGGRYVVVFSGARQRRDTTRRLQLLARAQGSRPGCGR
jgi:hypothetical protein